MLDIFLPFLLKNYEKKFVIIENLFITLFGAFNEGSGE